MSHVQPSIFSTSLLSGLAFPYSGEGIRLFIFTAFPLSFFIICYFLTERGKGLHLTAPGTVGIDLGCPVPPVGVDTIHHLDGHLHINCVFWDGTVEVMKVKFTGGLGIEIHSGKISILSFAVS